MGHLKFNGIEHYDHFMDETIFYAELSGLPQDIQEAARAIDGPAYDPSCFGICLCYNLKTKAVEVMEETTPTGEKGNIYYVDNNGDRKWFSLDFTNSAYRFPAAVPLTVDQETLNAKAIDITNYTFEQMMRRNDATIEKMREAGIRCKVHVEQNEYDYQIYCLYC